MAGHAQDIPCTALGFISNAGQYQVTVIVITVEQEAVIAIIPVFPGQKPDILGLDGEDFASIHTVKCLYFRIPLAEIFP